MGGLKKMSGAARRWIDRFNANEGKGVRVMYGKIEAT